MSPGGAAVHREPVHAEVVTAQRTEAVTDPGQR